ncbi:MAG: hypothetical protein PVF45_01705 [Anaerolineae bacterium]|jgi:hypothetical protein
MQTVSFETLIVFMVVLVLVGLAMALWLIFSIRQERRKKRPPAAVAEPAEQSPSSLPAAPSEPVAVLPPAAEEPAPSHQPAPTPLAQTREPVPGDVLLMRVLRDSEGFLVVEVDGQRYRRLFDIRDGEVGQRVLNIINRLAAFSKGRESRVPLPPSPQPAQEVPQVPAPTLPSPPVDEIVERQSQAFLDNLQQQPQTQRKKSRITADPVPFRQRSEARDSLISLNLAAEIDQLLQIRIKASPEFSQRFIHVDTAPDGGLRFRVDDGRYSGIDEIPDPQVQALMRDTIAEWEARR